MIIYSGTYTSALVIHARKAPSCQVEYAGSPIRVNQSIQINGITFPVPIRQESNVYQGPLQAATVTTKVPGSVKYTASLSSGFSMDGGLPVSAGSFVSLSQSGADVTLTPTQDLQNQKPGTYKGTITFTAFGYKTLPCRLNEK